MTVWIASTRRVVAHSGGLDLLDGHLYLSATRPDPRRGVLSQPLDDLLGGSVLGCVIRLGDTRIECGCQRPGLRPVHDHLDEPHSGCVLTQPTSRFATQWVETRDPRLVAVAVEFSDGLDAIGCGNETLSQPRSLGEVVVVDAGVVGLDVVARRGRVPAVYLHTTMHDSPPPTTFNNRPENASWAARSGRPVYVCLLYTSPSPRDRQKSRMPSSP